MFRMAKKSPEPRWVKDALHPSKSFDLFYQTPQLYLEFPISSGAPPKMLKGFTTVSLGPGERQQAQITISKFDISYWDVIGQGWKKPKGEIGVLIAQSSRQVRLRGHI